MDREKDKTSPDCASCDISQEKKICMTKDGIPFKGCPTLTRREELEKANKEYDVPEIQELSHQASVQEAACYQNRHQRPYIMQPGIPRVLEICQFAKKMKYKKIGIAFCVGLSREARTFEEILKQRGFDVVSILCKAGRTSKDIIRISDEDKIMQGMDESMCNPIFQAQLLNYEKTDLNVLIGLCVGHDSLFFKYAEAPTTVLAVKDRVTGHNPLAAIYLADSYYQKVRHPELG